MPKEDKKITVVTGGAGFVGSHICGALLKEGKKVICIDNFSTGSVRNIDPFLRNPDFQFLKLDINEPFDLESFVELDSFKIEFVGVDEIYHFAVPNKIKDFDDVRIDILSVSSLGTKNILDLAVKYGARILLASSFVVYGTQPDGREIVKESNLGVLDHLSARASFSEGRKFAETMFDTYAKVHDLDIRIARIFRTFGPNMSLKEGWTIVDLIISALNNEDLVVESEEVKTSLIYVSDVADGVLRLMQHDTYLGPINIGSDETLKIIDIANKIKELTQSSSNIVIKDTKESLNDKIFPDLGQAKENMSWLPVVRLDNGLQKTIEYIRANKVLLTE